jgi:hypothetical protein
MEQDRDFGSKPGSAGVMSGSNANVDRRERLRQLAMDTIGTYRVIQHGLTHMMLTDLAHRH